MRHHNSNRKFGREADQRTALLRSLARSLVLREKIQTTEPKAKELRPIVEKLVTRGKNPTLANRRLLVSRMGGDEKAVTKLVTIAERYATRMGGYIRITKMGDRKSDGAPMAVIEFVK